VPRPQYGFNRAKGTLASSSFTMYIFEIRDENFVAVVIEVDLSSALQRITMHYPFHTGAGECHVLARVDETRIPRLIAYQRFQCNAPAVQAPASST
jgi:hypothetical protein